MHPTDESTAEAFGLIPPSRAVRQLVTSHPECWWERRRRGIKNGARTTCPTCGIVAKFVDAGFGGPVNRLKDHSIRGEKHLVGEIPMGWMDQLFVNEVEWNEVREFQRTWLHEEVRRTRREISHD